tara:strand:- start:4904 stop:5401 length:498 start_codon:yes stop_codon:yes gene_type:complete
MKFFKDFISALKGPNKICDPLLLYILIGIYEFLILFMVYKDLTKEGFAPINSSTKLLTDKEYSNSNKCCDKCCDGNNNGCSYCDATDDTEDYINCTGDVTLTNTNNDNLYTSYKYHLIIIMNFMLYLYIIFGMFLYLLCKNNMKNAAWFVVLYPFLSKLVWMLII